MQELLDFSNDINFEQQRRGKSNKTWSHGPNRRRRPPRPALRPLPGVRKTSNNSRSRAGNVDSTIPGINGDDTQTRNMRTEVE